MLSGPLLQTDTDIHQIVLLLHGYGSNGADLLSVAYHWQDNLPHTLFMAPNAPHPYPYAPEGYMWFDFKDVEHITTDDMVKGLTQIRPTLEAYLRHLSSTYDVPLSKIIPVGFSQGAMIALDLLTSQQDIKKAIAYSGGYAPLHDAIQNPTEKHALLVHGTEDVIVPYNHMMSAQSALTALGIHVTPITCAGLGHSINQEGVSAGEAFLKESL